MDKLIALKNKGNEMFSKKEFIKGINYYEEALTQVNYRLDDVRKDP